MAETIERSDDGWMAYDDSLRIIVIGGTREEVAAKFADALAERRGECTHTRDSWFDRTLCPRDDWMHTICSDCGLPLDGICGQEKEE